VGRAVQNGAGDHARPTGWGIETELLEVAIQAHAAPGPTFDVTSKSLN